MRPLRTAVAVALLAAAPFAAALTPALRSAAAAALREGRADDAMRLLDTAAERSSGDPEAHLLRCRIHYGEEQWDDAIRECREAVALDPRDSSNHLWLGRALGEKADRVSFVTAYSLGKKVHTEFETAVALDPENVEALADLGEFYTEAPPLVGGGTEKALGIAARLDSLDAARAEELRGRIAVSQKDLPAAEQHFNAAVARAPQPASQYIVLASFYARQGAWDRMDRALAAGVAADKPHDSSLVDAAHVLLRTGRNPQLAAELLGQYLASPNKSADEPAYRVHALLASLLESQGHPDAAQAHYAQAAALASGYQPASRGATHSGR